MATRNSIAYNRRTVNHDMLPFKLALLASAISMIGFEASAQEITPLDRVVVSAQKRTESMQSVPISITAFSADQIEQGNIKSMADLAAATPNLSYLSDGTLKNKAPSIRGVNGPGANQAGMDAPMAMYVDEVYIGGTVGSTFDLFDVERVEVLRGPQGTLFGRNALSGLINIVTPTPGDTVKGFGEASYGNYQAVQLRGGVSGPLVKDRIYGSISATFADRDGFTHNRATGNDVDTEGNWSVRGKLHVIPSENVRVNWSVDARNVDQTTRTYDIGGYNPTPGSLFQPTGPAIVDTNGMDRSISQDFEGKETLREFGTSLTVDADVKAGTFKSITAYRTHKYFMSYDADNTEIPITIRETPEKLNSFSQEFRLTSKQSKDYDYIVGANYYYQNTTNEFASILNNTTLVGNRLFSTLIPESALGLPFPLAAIGFPDSLAFLTTVGALTPPFGETRSIGKTRLNSYAVYGNLTGHLSDKLNVNLGARYTREHKDFSYEQTSAPGNVFFQLPAIPLFDSSGSFSAFTPSLGVDYTVSKDAMAYAKASKGFKSGGFNDGFTSVAGTPFKSETLMSYEAGLKTTFWDGRARANLAAYQMDWKDVQNIFSSFNPPSVIPFFSVDTWGDERIRGIEAELSVRPTKRLVLNGSIGMVDAEWSALSARALALGAVVGSSVKYVPKVTLNGGINYSFPLENKGAVTAALNFQWRDKTPLTNIPTEPTERPAYTLVDGSLTYENSDGRWSVQLWGKNLTDRKFITNLFDVDNSPTSPIRAIYQSLGAPRTVGVKVRFNY